MLIYIAYVSFYIMLRLHLNLNLNQMKNLHSILLSLFIIAIMSSCSHEPKACFTVDLLKPDGTYITTNKGKVGERFYFSPMCSEHNFSSATIFEYGDGTKGSEEGHEYNKPGSYTVKCKVFAADHGAKGEKSAEFSQAVTVLPSEKTASLK